MAAHIQQESKERVREAPKHKVRPHILKLEEIDDHVYYEKDKEDEWRGLWKVIGRDGKVVVIKQGLKLKEIGRVHIIRLKGRDEEVVE